MNVLQESKRWESISRPGTNRNRGVKRVAGENCDDELRKPKIKCVESPFSRIPNEVLLEIFNHMDHQSLISSVLVCKRWNQIISNSRSTMEKLPLLVNSENYDPKGAVPRLTRRYDTVTIEDIYRISKCALDRFRKIGENVTTLKLNDCILYDREFIRLCRCFPNLTSLSIRWCSLGVGLGTVKRTSARPAELKHLKNLVIWGEGWMLDNIKCNKLDHLTLNRFYVEDQRNLVKFLNELTALKSLLLCDIDDLFTTRNPRETLDFKLSFQLEEISLFNLRFADEKSLLTLLENAKNATSASIGFDVAPVIAREIIKHFKNLTYLYIDADLLNNAINFDILPKNYSLKALKVCGLYREPVNFLVSFLSLFPNVEHLDLISLEGVSHTNSQLWHSMSQNMKKLESLEINRLNVFNLVMLKNPQMKCLTVDHLGYTNEISWEVFAKNNPKVEYLSIKTTPVQIYYGSDVLRAVKSLKHLEYYRNFRVGPHQPFSLF